MCEDSTRKQKYALKCVSLPFWQKMMKIDQSGFAVLPYKTTKVKPQIQSNRKARIGISLAQGGGVGGGLLSQKVTNKRLLSVKEIKFDFATIVFESKDD